MFSLAAFLAKHMVITLKIPRNGGILMAFNQFHSHSILVFSLVCSVHSSEQQINKTVVKTIKVGEKLFILFCLYLVTPSVLYNN